MPDKIVVNLESIAGFAKKHRKGLLIAGAIAIVAAGQIELIPWTAAGALEFLGTASAAAGVAGIIDKQVSDKSK